MPFVARKAVEIVTVYVVFDANDDSGVNVKDEPLLNSDPLTDGLMENAEAIDVGSIKKLQYKSIEELELTPLPLGNDDVTAYGAVVKENE